MKRILSLFLMIPAFAFAQKIEKPKITKALSAWREGNLSEAKDIIDAATTYEKTKDDGKTWYYRGLIYATIDTTSNPTYKALSDNALEVAMESFKKGDQLIGEGKEHFTPIGPGEALPTTKSMHLAILSDYYLNKGIKEVQKDDPDYNASISDLKKSTKVFETLKTYPNDTLAYYILGFAANNAEQDQVAIDALTKYIDKGGSSKDPYILMYQIYQRQENDEKALEMVRKAKKAFPNDSDFPRLEIGMLIDMNKVDEAKNGLIEAIKQSPNDKTLHFYLAYTYTKLKDTENALKEYKECLRIDPTYYEAQYHMSQIYLDEIAKITQEINNLGISAADDKKKRELYPARVKKAEAAIPMYEKLESMQAPDTDTRIDVLEKLRLLYDYVVDDAKSKVVTQKLKALGAE